MRLQSLTAVATALFATVAYAQSWDESAQGGGDAGDLLPSAQQTVGTGALATITGSIDTPDIDMYCITITDPQTFTASTVGGAVWDTQLWLFDGQGMGVTMNDDSPGGGLQSDLTGQFVPAPGTYYLAVSRFDADALDAAGAEIWNNSPFGEERAPDGPGAGNALVSWDISPSTAGPYTISLTGASYHTVPAPGALALLGLAGLVSSRRRR